jgi:RNA polymerase sigma-70 factor (ECF subfamily)
MDATSESLDALLLGQADWVRRLARGLVADAHLAEDLAQDALLLALERPPRSAGLRGWLAAVVRNLAAEGRRSAGRRLTREESAARGEALASTEELVQRTAARRDLVDAVLGLSEPYRTTLMLFYFEELSLRSLAQHQGTPIATVKARLARGRAALRKSLDQRAGGAERALALVLLPLAQDGPRPPFSLPPATSTFLGALIVNAKILVLSLAVALAGTVAFLRWSKDDPGHDPVVSPASASARSEQLAPSLSTPFEGEVVAAGTPPTRGEYAVEEVASPSAPSSTTPIATPAFLTGRVVDLASSPLSGIGVRRGTAATTSAGDGGFRFEHDAGSGEVRVDDPLWTTVLAVQPLPADSGREAILVAAPRLRLSGVVLDAASGLVVEGASVCVELPRDFRAGFALDLDRSTDATWVTTSDARGEFLLADAPRCPTARCVARASGFLPWESPLQASEAPLVIALERTPLEGDVLRGRVVDRLGAPVADARVAFGIDVKRSDPEGLFQFQLEAPQSFNGQFNAMATRFGAEPLVPGELSALVPGALPARFVAPRDESGAPRWPSFVTLRLGEEPLEIAGTVVDEQGNPVADVQVWLGDPTFFGGLGNSEAGDEPGFVHVETLLGGFEEGWHSEATDAQGRFRITGLLEREYTLQALRETDLLRAVVPNVRAGDARVLVELPESEAYPVLAGLVVGSDGKPLPGVSVYPMCDAFKLIVGGNPIRTHHSAIDGVATDAEGRFALVNVPKNLVYLRLDGHDVLPLEWGRHVQGGLAELVGERASELVIRVARRAHFQIELSDPTEADEFALCNAAGQELEVSEFAGNSRREGLRHPLLAGRSNPMAAPDDATTLVLYREGDELRRVPIRLVAGERTLLKP